MSKCLCKLDDVHDHEVIKAALRCMKAFYVDYIATEEVEQRKEAAQMRIDDVERIINAYK